MFSLRTTDHTHILDQFYITNNEALGRILGCPLPPIAYQQAELPVSMGGLGLRLAAGHAAAAYTASVLSSHNLVRSMLPAPQDDPSPSTPQWCQHVGKVWGPVNTSKQPMRLNFSEVCFLALFLWLKAREP